MIYVRVYAHMAYVCIYNAKIRKSFVRGRRHASGCLFAVGEYYNSQVLSGAALDFSVWSVECFVKSRVLLNKRICEWGVSFRSGLVRRGIYELRIVLSSDFSGILR